MTLMARTNERKWKEVEALRVSICHAIFEHCGIPKEERANYEQIDRAITDERGVAIGLAVALCALAPAVAAMLVATHQDDAAAEHFLDLLQYHVRQTKGMAFGHVPVFYGRTN